LGFLVGAGVYAALYPNLFAGIQKIADYGSTILPTLWNLNAMLMALLFAESVLILFYFLERKIGVRKDKVTD
jgi:hypothetical protein